MDDARTGTRRGLEDANGVVAPRRPRRARWAARAIMGAYGLAAAAVVVADASRGHGGDSRVEGVVLLVGFGLFTALGALLVARRPGHPIGRLFAAVGLMIAVGAAGDAVATAWVFADRPPVLWVRLLLWPNAWYWYALLVVVFVYVPLLFPDGRLPSPRWRGLAWVVAAVTLGLCMWASLAEHVVLQATREAGDPVALANPLGISGIASPEEHPVFNALLLVPGVGMLGAAVSVVVRFRRSDGIERQQLKLVLLPIALLPVSVLSELLPGGLGDLLGAVGLTAMVLLFPLAIAVAVLRYRLWDVDRLISRTLSYTLVTLVLTAVYVALVLGAQVVGPDDSPDVVVAGSTLVVASLFRPLRARVQATVDRRFARTAHDARLAVEAFAGRLRDQIDLEALQTEVVANTRRVVHPSAIGLWLPTVAEEGPTQAGR